MVENIIDEADAFIAAWLPGTEAEGITDVLFGNYAFTGKLSHTWPTSISQVPINYGDSPYNPLFPYGYGLSSTVPVITTNLNSTLEVFPNPADKIINIEYKELLNQPVILNVYNSNSEAIISKQIVSSNTQININNLSSGVYYLKIVNGNRVKHGMFIKQ
jgi:hypothetical protein